MVTIVKPKPPTEFTTLATYIGRLVVLDPVSTGIIDTRYGPSEYFDTALHVLSVSDGEVTETDAEVLRIFGKVMCANLSAAQETGGMVAGIVRRSARGGAYLEPVDDVLMDKIARLFP